MTRVTCKTGPLKLDSSSLLMYAYKYRSYTRPDSSCGAKDHMPTALDMRHRQAKVPRL